MQGNNFIPAVSSVSEGLTTKPGLGNALQALTAICFREQVQVHCTHAAGSRNMWADQISRLHKTAGSFRRFLVPSRRIDVEWKDLLGAKATVLFVFCFVLFFVSRVYSLTNVLEHSWSFVRHRGMGQKAKP